MPERLAWLPPELYPAALRIARADECAYAMGELAGMWSFEEPLVLEQLQHGDRYTIRVKAIRPIPPRISLLFSEAINHLRAALDNVVWHMVEVIQGPVVGRVASQVRLPIYSDQTKFDNWCRDRARAGLTAFDTAADLGQRIRSLQPFVDKRSNVPSTQPWLAAVMGSQLELAHPLELLQGYSNGDKHRTVRVAVPRTSGGSVGQPLGEPGRAFVELKVGDVVSEGTWGQLTFLEQSSAVLIQRPEPYWSLVAPANEVSRLAVMSREVVPRFGGESV